MPDVWPSVMVTGHRPQHLPAGSHDWVRRELTRLAEKVRTEHDTTTGVSGMALGPDLWWADAVMDAYLRLWAHIPFPQQPDRWHPERQAEEIAAYRRLCRSAWKLTTYGGYYDVGFLHARNDGMLKVSAAVIAVLLPGKTDGGTASAVAKAEKLGLPIIHVNPEARVTTLRRPIAQTAPVGHESGGLW